MKVDLLAHTIITDAALDLLPPLAPRDQSHTTSPDHLAEVAGRQCYKSWHRPNEKTAENVDYLAHILEIDHTSIMEHSMATFRLTGVSRNLLVELTRHRHLSPSVVSQRYVDESFGQFIVPPDLADNAETFESIIESMRRHHAQSRQLYGTIVAAMTQNGYKRKQARQAARSVLPGGHETEIIITGNIRAWRHVISMRYSIHADVEICRMAGEILAHLREIAPNQVQDIEDDPRS
jgi:thymidylate synthase (FAD)